MFGCLHKGLYGAGLMPFAAKRYVGFGFKTL